MTKGFQATVIVLAAAALFSARPAAAHISPAGCNGNGVQVSIGVVNAVGGRIVNGQTVTYNFSIGNLNAPLITACDTSGVLVRFYCPGADGLPDLTNPIDVQTVTNLPAGTQPFALPSKTCTVNVNPGVTQAIAEVIAGKQTGAIGFACSPTSGNCNQGRLHQTSTDLSFRSDKVVGVAVDTCAASIDKLVSCDGGVTYHSVGANNTADFCTGWNATATMPAESIFVRYVVTNQGSAGLFSCSLTESNGGIVGANGTTFTNIPGRSCVGGDLNGQPCTTDADCPGEPAGTCPPQTLTTDFNNQTCSASLAAAEPDTASVNCFCTSDHIPNLTATAQDTARFDCRTPGLTVTKDCLTRNANGGNPVTITVTNSGTADLANCAITDTVFGGAPCPATTGPSSNVSISPSTITSLPQGAGAVTATGIANGLTQDSCNTVSVTCDIVGSVDRTNPSQRKKITATALATCPVPPVCGDNHINQSSETCDGTDLDATACTSCRASGGPDACTCCGDKVFQPSDGTCDGTQTAPGLPAIPGGETCRLPANSAAPCTYCGDGTVQSAAGETCDPPGSACTVNGGPGVCGAAGSAQACTCVPCAVQVDKQVMCGPGQPFVDSGFVTANEDGTLSCAGINGQPIDVQYRVRNTGGTPVFGCTLTDSNGNILSTPASVGNIDAGSISATIDVNNKACSSTLAASEPDTATVSCFCSADLNPNLKASAFDSANIECAGLTVDKVCRQNSDNTDSFDVKLTNNGSVDLSNCVVSDTFFPGDTSCTNGATTAPGFPKTVASLAQHAMSTVSGNVGVLSADSCNKASATCNIVGSTNTITAMGSATCPGGMCSLCVSKTACIQAPPPPTGQTCTGAAIAMTLTYTGTDINGPATVVITGSNSSVTTTYNLSSLHAGDVLTKASENGFSIDATAHGQSSVGSRTTITINGVVEVLHTSCSCTATPETNLAVCDPMCLDSSSPDNSTGTKGPPSPLWTLVSLKDKTLGIETCNSDGSSGPCETALSPVTASCVGHVKDLVLEYNGGSCAAMSNQQQADKVKCTQSGSTPNASPVRLRITDGGGGTVWVDTGAANVAIGDDVTVNASNAGKATLAGDTAVNVFNSSNTLIERVQFKTDCSQPLAVGNIFGGFKVVSFTTDKGGSSAAGTTVNYTYKVVNTGTGPANNVTLQDDKLGTVPGSPISSIPAGGMVTLTAQKVVNQTTINTVTASCNNGQFSTQATAAVVGPCVLGYPYTSSNAKTATVFNESEVLRAFRPLGSAGVNDRIQAFYSDEHAMLLGVKTSTASVSPFTPAPGKLSSFVLSPQVGDLVATDPFGRPFFPALFLTDITADPALICTAADPQNATRCHDWQWGGTAIPPTAVFGTWKAATKVGTTILTGTDPAKNNFDLDGSGNCTTSPPSATCPDVVPSGLTNQGYGTEARWDVNGLGLTTGHIYRAQFMVHDGDQNKTGGDVGQGCLTVFIVPETPCP